ncbi:putative membrane-associated oxidoreductase [Isosphaera pallida ATCC 43644]|jgi:hypothetical protein|uniref:Membrane-associated oxidoreductase n=1 Tax=Isosphaera pallida (strain ATCC 43644 / DSM 9630 / IS1B) TaxID=575540 RepID=E8R6Q3_ISOPI|nr:hypothetical protein [Isosphaera pallida]ADV63955.1 putative membrane-associated oxidoreductase [Isosphaera pallida ATCC 43644]
MMRVLIAGFVSAALLVVGLGCESNPGGPSAPSSIPPEMQNATPPATEAGVLANPKKGTQEGPAPASLQ